MAHLSRDAGTRPATGPGRDDRLIRLLRSFRFALRGLRYAWRTQPNLRLESLVGLVALGLAVWLQTGLVAVVICIISVLSLELVNTAIETLVDLVSPDHHPLAGAAKDTAAAAVFIATVGSVVVGLLLFTRPLLEKVGLIT